MGNVVLICGDLTSNLYDSDFGEWEKTGISIAYEAGFKVAGAYFSDKALVAYFYQQQRRLLRIIETDVEAVKEIAMSMTCNCCEVVLWNKKNIDCRDTTTTLTS